MPAASNEGASEQAPDYRVYAGALEIDGGWKKTSSAGQGFLSIFLDDPDLDPPVYVRLFLTDDPDTFNPAVLALQLGQRIDKASRRRESCGKFRRAAALDLRHAKALRLIGEGLFS